jgi:hypothetical protein
MKRLVLALAVSLGLAAPVGAAEPPDEAGTAEAITVLKKERERRVVSYTVRTPSL